MVVSPIGAGDHGKVAEFLADAWIPDASAHKGGAAVCEVKLANVAKQDVYSAVCPAAPSRWRARQPCPGRQALHRDHRRLWKASKKF